MRLIRETLFPLALMVATVLSAVALPYIVVKNGGSVFKESLVSVIWNAWSTVNLFDLELWALISFTAVCAVFSVTLPGKRYHGPPTASGFRPQYTHSGFLFYLLSCSVLILILSTVSVSHLYPKYVDCCAMLAILGLILSCAVYVKGLLAPSEGLHGSSGNPVFDFYWGIELYPRFGNMRFDIKTIVNCRFGLWLWQAIVAWAWKVDFEMNGGQINWPLTVSTVLQTVYLAKFFYWEDGYMSTIDIAVDKFGFYEGWGCTAWVPTFYTLTSVYMINRTPQFGPIVATLLTIVGLLFIFLNYETDRQRMVFRASLGKCKIWGKDPVYVTATYATQSGKEKESLLLASGLWGYSRHLNYVFELAAALSWALPAVFESIIPYLYFCFLTALLVHRSHRDDMKCKEKYAKGWDQYCAIVPWKILPFVF